MREARGARPVLLPPQSSRTEMHYITQHYGRSTRTASPSVIDCCRNEFCLYDLSDLGQHFGLKEMAGNHFDSATHCKMLLQKLLNKDDVDIVIEKSVPGLENSAISELACPKLQIPDLYL